ncbi:MAG: hypothetical protein GY765_31635, partial [bacterium]|nr:hypothetical protein [bacterium]
QLPGGDDSRVTQLPGGDDSQVTQLPGGDDSRVTQLPGGDDSQVTQLPGGDDSRVTHLPVDIESRKDIIKKNIETIFKQYQPQRIIRTPLLMVKARDSEHKIGHEDLWSRMSTGRTVCFDTPGDHETIFEEPNVGQLAKIIKGEPTL